MRWVGTLICGVLIGCLQVALHGLAPAAVIPNIALITLVVLLHRWSFEDLASFALACGIILETSSAQQSGTQLIALLLIVLIGKLTLRQANDTGQTGLLVVIGICATIAYGLVGVLALPVTIILPATREAGLRILLEVLYNGVSIGLGLVLLNVRTPSPASYRLP